MRVHYLGHAKGVPDKLSEGLRVGFRVGPYLVRPKEGRIEGPNGTQQVEPRVMEVLVVLALHHGQIVTRDELLNTVWNDAVVGDEVLSRAVSLLRQVFGDERTQPQFIRTIPRQGYELIAPVKAEQRFDPRWWAMLVVIFLLAAGIFVWQNTEEESGHTVVAVLPPTVVGLSELGPLSEGIADHLIGELSRVPQLEVVSRRASFGVRDANVDLSAIRTLLDADILIEGRLKRDAGEYLVDLSLTDVLAGTLVWSEQVVGNSLRDVEAQALQGVLTGLNEHLKLNIKTRKDGEAQVSEEAYLKYLEAKYQWTLRGERRIARSIARLREVLELESGFAQGYLALAQSLALQPFYTDMAIDPQFEEARALASRAEGLSPALRADVLALEGFMLGKEWQWQQAGQALRDAIKTDSANVNARYWYSIHLAQLGRYADSLEQMKVAVDLDPLSAVFNDRLGLAYAYVGDLDMAQQHFSIAQELGYLESTQPLSVLLYLLRTQAWQDMQDYLVRIGGDRGWVEPLVDGLRDPNSREAAIVAIENASSPLLEMLKVPVWVLYDEHDRAFESFRMDRKTLLVEFLWIPEAASWREHPKFPQLLRALGFDEALN